MPHSLSARSRSRLTGVHLDLVRVVERAIELPPVDFAVTQGVRTQAEQNELFVQGRTKPGKIVTMTRNSRHIGGNAVDLAPGSRARSSGMTTESWAYGPPLPRP